MMPTCAEVLPAGIRPGQLEDRRHADAALPDRALAMEQRRVARQPLAAVVLRVDHQRVARQAQALERRENLSDALIRALENRGVVLPRVGRILLRLDESRRCPAPPTDGPAPGTASARR